MDEPPNTPQAEVTPPDVPEVIVDFIVAEGDDGPVTGCIHYGPIDIHVVCRQGDYRRGTSPDGTEWAVRAPYHYGEVVGSTGADGDRVDAWVCTKKYLPRAYVVAQKMGGVYDEDKVFLGFHDPWDALFAYLQCYADAIQNGVVDAPTEDDVDVISVEDLARAATGEAVVMAKAKAAPVGTQTTRRDGSRWEKTSEKDWRQVKDGNRPPPQGEPDSDPRPPGTADEPKGGGQPAVAWKDSYDLDGNQPDETIHPTHVEVDAQGNIDTKPVLMWKDANGRDARSYTVAFHQERYKTLRTIVAGNRPLIEKAWKALIAPRTDAEMVARMALSTGHPPDVLLSIPSNAIGFEEKDTHLAMTNTQGRAFTLTTQDEALREYMGKNARKEGPLFNATAAEVKAVLARLGVKADDAGIRAVAIATKAADIASKLPKVDFSKSRTAGETTLKKTIASIDAVIAADMGHPPPPPGMSYVPPALVAALAEEGGAARYWPRTFGTAPAPDPNTKRERQALRRSRQIVKERYGSTEGKATMVAELYQKLRPQFEAGAIAPKGARIAMRHGLRSDAPRQAKTFAAVAVEGPVPLHQARRAWVWTKQNPCDETDPRWPQRLCYGGRVADWLDTLAMEHSWVLPEETWNSASAEKSSSSATSSTTSASPEPSRSSTPTTKEPPSPTPSPSPEPSAATSPSEPGESASAGPAGSPSRAELQRSVFAPEVNTAPDQTSPDITAARAATSYAPSPEDAQREASKAAATMALRILDSGVQAGQIDAAAFLEAAMAATLGHYGRVVELAEATLRAVRAKRQQERAQKAEAARVAAAEAAQRDLLAASRVLRSPSGRPTSDDLAMQAAKSVVTYIRGRGLRKVPDALLALSAAPGSVQGSLQILRALRGRQAMMRVIEGATR